MLWIGPRDAAQHPTVYRIIHPQQRITQPQMSVLEEDLEKGGEINKTCLLPTERHHPLFLWLLSQHRESELSFRQTGIPDGVISGGFLSLPSAVQIRFCESCLRSISSSLAPNSDLRTLPSHSSNEGNENTSPP